MRSLLRQLNRWRFRERLVRLVWGLSRWLAAAAIALAAACAVDWTYDRYADVPGWFRFGMLAVQTAVAFVLAHAFVVKPWNATPPIDELAGRAEAAIPEFDHRLVTAIQLNRPSARTAGMSAALIAEVTEEASDLAARHGLTQLVDYSRVGWAVLVVAPIALFWAAFFLLFPDVASSLLKRQAMLDAEIPRSLTLTNATVPLWPSGDEVEIRYHVSGKFNEATKGTVSVRPEGQSEDRYPLAFQSVDGDGRGTFVAKVPPSSVAFSFAARLSDARSRSRGEVRFEPRPVVKDVEAWSLVPGYLGLVPAGTQKGRRFERAQNRGEVQNLPGSTDRVKPTTLFGYEIDAWFREPSARVRATFQKPVAKAELVPIERNANGGERDSARLPMQIEADGLAAVVTFDLSPQRIAYRIEVEDSNGFRNLSPPRRSLILLPDEPPKVVLLQEAFKDPDPTATLGRGPIDDYEVNGIPVMPGGQFMVGFNARSPLGIGEVRIHYRVNDEEGWGSLPLSPVAADPKAVGTFVPELGLFQKSGRRGQVELYKFPSPNPESEPGELEAGGRYNFQSGGLTKAAAEGRAKLEPGDRVEFYVEASDKAPGARPFGRSESRIKAVVTEAQERDWRQQHDQSRERLRAIEEKQRGVFRAAKP